MPLVAGNWKMNKTVAEAIELVDAMFPRINGISDVERLVCPPFTAICSVWQKLKDSDVRIGAQNLYWEDGGAFTGAISPLMLKEFCSYVIIGHSERRAYFGETDETVNRRVKAALHYDMRAIVCVGETLEENESGMTVEVIRREVRIGLKGLELKDAPRIVIAYEPIWAIGTGKAATPEGADAVIAGSIRSTLAEMLTPDIAQSIRVLYGGSIKPENAAGFFAMPEIDGGLIGGASLRADDFIEIVAAARV
jgi:triosephosphate isomerase